MILRGGYTRTTLLELLESEDIRVLNEKELSEQPIRVNVRAPRNVHEIFESSPSEIEASIDFNDVIISEVLSADSPVIQQLSVYADIGQGGEYMSINPKTVSVRLDKFITRTLDVRVEETGAVDEEHELIGIESAVKTVTVSAAQSIVEQVAEVRADVELSGAMESFSLAADLAVYNREGVDITDMVELDTTETTVFVTILPQKEVTLSIGYTGSLMYNHVVTETIITPESVLIIGLPSVLAEINEIELAPLDLTNHNQTYNTSVDISDSLPSNIKLKTGQPAEAAVIYTIEPLRTQEFLVPSEDIRIVGYSGLAVRLEERDSVSITVQGPGSDMDAMSAAQISAQLNVSERGVGEHTVPLRVYLPDGITLVGTPVVDITISEPRDEHPEETIWEVTFGDDGGPVFTDIETRELYSGALNPDTGLPMTGVVIDPETGLLVSGIDPVTGLPVNMIDPGTGDAVSGDDIEDPSTTDEPNGDGDEGTNGGGDEDEENGGNG